MTTIYAARQSFVGELEGQTLDIRAGDLFEADHAAVAKWPDLFGPVTLRFPVNRSSRVEQATAAPGERRRR